MGKVRGSRGQRTFGSGKGEEGGGGGGIEAILTRFDVCVQICKDRIAP